MAIVAWFEPEYTWYVRLAIGFWFWLVLGVVEINNYELHHELHRLLRATREALEE